MQALTTTAKCYGTRFFTTNPRAKIEGATHIEFNEHDPFDAPNQIIELAIERFKNRPGKVTIPQVKNWGVHGFSHEYVNYMLGGRFRGSYTPLIKIKYSSSFRPGRYHRGSGLSFPSISICRIGRGTGRRCS
jgi:hydroxylamine reductase (hybrid-cluster protein)